MVEVVEVRGSTMSHVINTAALFAALYTAVLLMRIGG
jgi:hypothetical protein